MFTTRAPAIKRAVPAGKNSGEIKVIMFMYAYNMHALRRDILVAPRREITLCAAKWNGTRRATLATERHRHSLRRNTARLVAVARIINRCTASVANDGGDAAIQCACR
jgi:hypothetical protein